MGFGWFSVLALFFCVTGPVLGARIDSALIIPFKLKNGRPYVDATVNGKRINLLFDLGGYQTIGLSAKDALDVGAETLEVQEEYKSYEGAVHQTYRIHLKDV